MTDTVWFGTLDEPGDRGAAADAHRVSDAAKAGRWSELWATLDSAIVQNPNAWRPGGTSWYAPLHQAAWHGAPVEVAQQLIDRGAWRSLPNAQGDRPVDIARTKGHQHLLDVLAPVAHTFVEPALLPAIERHLGALVESRIRPELDVRLRHPSLAVLAEIGTGLWYPIPGMYGGFNIELREHHLYVESWSRVADGSGQAHVVTAEGFFLVRRGFV